MHCCSSVVQGEGSQHLCAEVVLAAPQRPAQTLQHPVAEHLHQVAGLHGEAERHRAARVRWSDVSSDAANCYHQCVGDPMARDLALAPH